MRQLFVNLQYLAMSINLEAMLLLIIIFILAFPQQGVTQGNSNATTYSCTVDFVPPDPHTDQMATWTATARASVVLSASHRVSGSIVQKSRDKRVADTACQDFFAERARHQSPAEDTALGK